jgi:hypothetical protein
MPPARTDGFAMLRKGGAVKRFATFLFVLGQQQDWLKPKIGSPGRSLSQTTLNGPMMHVPKIVMHYTVVTDELCKHYGSTRAVEPAINRCQRDPSQSRKACKYLSARHYENVIDSSTGTAASLDLSKCTRFLRNRLFALKIIVFTVGTPRFSARAISE